MARAEEVDQVSLNLQAAITALESARGRALVEEDWSALDALIAPDLIHIHANGASEDRAGYFEGVRQRLAFLHFERESLVVRGLGDTAIATGILKQTVRDRKSGALFDLRLVTTQVWVRDTQGWRQASFHATHLASA
jgi:ketosteroid isomerase-like protein